MKRPLTKPQQAVLDCIQESIRQHGYPPTLREIAEVMGWASTNGVSAHLRRLERKGVLQRRPGTARGMRVLA